ncbi:L-serine dehydratase, iron-sulfur-dependent, alpha subunit [Aminomonas paucivorans DSM 12260]|uniref:L-serine dehydratase n=1 Tax=Aminomonas paucivorans DSM 12260 TaxID=584708 RepID=E3CZ27_9BACT|nr:L-serine ammonia-lyase, iron-sulfur-dependent, subunit alpha [Aminomonas paucivorans]EFQ22800.1 L-serine dehydratase, iron-sulfur-dependent, alpha subunit [Aminomonas paucivorans DSM 12260]
MRSFEAILARCREGLSLPEAVLALEEEERGIPAAEVRERMRRRLEDLEASVRGVEEHPARGRLVGGEAERMEAYLREGSPLSGPFTAQASALALKVATGNAAMRRIVAAPTAGSCGILPGVLVAYRRTFAPSEEELLAALVVAGAVGSVVAERATLAGAEGGCQAECGAAAAMAASALAVLRGGSPEDGVHAAALVLQSVLGLVCDPVAGLVEVPCVLRNGSLVGLAVLGADLALSGIRSLIPPDEVVDALGSVGRALPASLRETSRGGLAVTPTGAALARRLASEAPRLEG